MNFTWWQITLMIGILLPIGSVCIYFLANKLKGFTLKRKGNDIELDVQSKGKMETTITQKDIDNAVLAYKVLTIKQKRYIRNKLSNLTKQMIQKFQQPLQSKLGDNYSYSAEYNRLNFCLNVFALKVIDDLINLIDTEDLKTMSEKEFNDLKQMKGENTSAIFNETIMAGWQLPDSLMKPGQLTTHYRATFETTTNDDDNIYKKIEEILSYIKGLSEKNNAEVTGA